MVQEYHIKPIQLEVSLITEKYVDISQLLICYKCDNIKLHVYLVLFLKKRQATAYPFPSISYS